MAKLNNNEMNNVSGGVQIREIDGQWEVIKTVETFPDKQSAEKFVERLADDGADMYGHHKHCHGPECFGKKHNKPEM